MSRNSWGALLQHPAESSASLLTSWVTVASFHMRKLGITEVKDLNPDWAYSRAQALDHDTIQQNTCLSTIHTNIC